MNKFQPVIEISLRPTESPLAATEEPQLGLRTDVQLHVQAIGELIHTLLTQLELLRQDSNYSDDVPSLNLHEEVRCFEINLIQRALSRTHGSQVEAARFLGLKPTTLNAKIKKYRLHRPYMLQLASSEFNQPT